MKKTPATFSNRDFLGRVVWKAEEGGKGFVLVSEPMLESDKRPVVKDVLRGSYWMSVKVVRVDEKWSALE
jgi:hypothetical protein